MIEDHDGDQDSYTAYPGITAGKSREFATNRRKVGDTKDGKNPVYLGKTGKNIMYHMEGMQTGKTFNWVLKKTKDSMEFYRFEP